MVTSETVKQMQIIRKSQFLGVLQVKHLSSSSEETIQSHVVRLILDQKTAAEAIKTFRSASDLHNFKYSESTYRALIHKLCIYRRFDAVKDLLDEMTHTLGSPPDDGTFVTVIRGLGRAGMVRRVFKVLDIVSRFHGKPSLKIFNSVLDVLVKENIDLARDFFRTHMMESGVQGDDYTFAILMKGLCSTNRIAEAFKLLRQIKSRGVAPNAVIYNTLLHALCRYGNVGKARKLMDEIEKPSDVTFNIMISAYCAEGNLAQALILLEKAFSSGCLPDVITTTKVFEVLCELGRVSEAAEILERVESKGGKVDVVSHNTLIKGFCKLGKPKIGCRILKEMESKGCLPTADTYNILISGLCESGLLESAMDMFNEMKTVAIKWNFNTFDTLIKGLCSGRRVKDGFQVLELMEETKEGCGGRISPYNSILYGLYKENRTDEALEFLTKMNKLFPRSVGRSLKILDLCKELKIDFAKSTYDQMVDEGGFPSALVYSSLISGFCQEGRLREALELMNVMIASGYSPVASTFNSIIVGLCNEGRVDSAVTLIEDMVSRGCDLDAGSYGPILNGFCKEGDLQMALNVLAQMIDTGMVPDHLSWNSLILCLYQDSQWLEKNQNAHVKKDLEHIMDNC